MESAVRRVVNLRMKSNAKFWLVENAQAMLLMRSYLKAGRFDDLIDWSGAMAVPWWCPEPPELLHQTTVFDDQVTHIGGQSGAGHHALRRAV